MDWRNDSDKRKPTYSKESLSQCQCTPRNFTLTGLVSNSNRYGERPTTKRWTEKQNQPELLSVALLVYVIKCN